jgi:probable F420-dependent oxidoreductase
MTTGTSARPFRFGVTGRGETLAQWQDFARKAEDLGYSSLLLPDHFGPQFAPLLALGVAAQATTRLRFGTLVLDNDFRHPVMLAKEAATLDLLSEGRFELGIGTGSQPRDNEQAGLPLDPPGTRVERIVETLAILKQFFEPGRETVDYQGKHYQVRELRAYPKPVQQPRPPILMGASGARMLRIAAREADIMGVMGQPDSLEEKMAVVREAAGERYGQIEFNTLYMRVQVDGQPASSGPAFPGIPSVVGSKEQIVEQLLAQRERMDVSYAVIIGTGIDAFAPIVARLNGR